MKFRLPFWREILFAGLWLFLATPAMATDVTISSLTWANLPFNASNLGTDRSITVTATNGSPTVTSSAAFPANIVGIGGFKVAIGGTTYTVASIASTSSLTLTTNFSGSTGSAVMTLYKYVLLRAYATASFQPNGEVYVVQPGTPGTGNFYKQVAASIINGGSGNVLYTPDFVLPATTNATINNQARYAIGWYRSDGSFIQALACGSVTQIAVPATTPTTWGALCTYNSPGGVVPPNNEVYTKTQIDVRFPSCSSGQMLYYAATGNIQSCLTVGTNLSITGGTLNASGGGGGGGITIGSTSITSGTSGRLLYDNSAVVGELALGSTLTISGGTLTTTGLRNAVNALDYGADPTGSANSTTAIVNWITACQASGARVCYLPGGTYLTDPITLSLNGLRIVGDGREKSILKARVANNPIVNITSANYAVNFTIDGIGFVGQGKTSGSSGHCVSISDATGGTAQFVIRNASFSACGGKGLYIPYMFAGRFENNIFDEIGDNHMEIQGGSATIVAGTDFKTLEANKIALWIYSGNPVVTGNNGIEPDSGSGSIWGRFGRSSADGDGADSYVLNGTFSGNNVEDFKATGWQFRTGSGGSTYAGNTFISPSSGTVTALYYYFLSGTELGIWSGGTFTLQGSAAWTNSQPVHARGYAPFYVSGTNTPANFYEWNAAETRTLPYVRPKLLAGTTKNGLQISELLADAIYDSGLQGTITGANDPSGNASRILLQNGSASRPVFASSVDSTTGAFFGSNTIGLTIGGTARFTLTSTSLTITPPTTFSPTATLAGLNVGSVGGDPSGPNNGDIWYDSTGHLLRARINGATVSLSAGGGGGSPGGSSGNLQWNNSSSFAGVSGSTVTSLGYMTLAPTLSSSGSPVLLTLTGPAHTTLAADTEANDVLWNLSRTVQFTSGGASFSTQRAMRIQAPTYAFTSADTITQAITLGLNTPSAGTNATLTESIGLQVAPSANAHIGIDVNHQSGASGDLLRLGLNGTYIFRAVPVGGDVNFVFADSALGTTATDGFVYFPSMAGVPSGVPTGYTGTVPLVIDTTNSRLYGRISGSWVNLSAGGGASNPFADNSALVKNNADNTKLLILSAASITTGTTRTLTAPDANDTIAVLGTAQTLTGRNTFATAVTTGTGSTAGMVVTANSLTTGNGLDVSSSSVTSGRVASFAATGTAAASNTKTALYATTSGANGTATQTTYGGYFTNTSTGTTSTNVAGFFTASGGTNNYGIQVGAGQVIVPDGTAALPSYSSTTYPTTGAYFSSNSLNFSVAGVLRGNFDNAYGFNVGDNSTGTGIITAKGSSSATGFYVRTASVAGSQGGVVLPFEGGQTSYGPGIWWASSASYGSLSGIYLNQGLNWQAPSSTHSKWKLRSSTGSASDGTVNVVLDPDNLNILVGTGAVTGNLTLATDNAATNTAVTVARFGVNSTGTAAAGFGPRVDFAAETSTTADTQMAAITSLWNVATHASRTADLQFATVNNAGSLTAVGGYLASQHYGASEFDNGNKSGSFTIDWNSGNNQKLTATGNLSTITFSNIKVGAQYVLTISQDGTGGRTWTPPTTFKMPGGVAGNVLTGTASAKDVFVCISADGTNLYCNGLYDVKNP